jgi:protein-tyrosine phosphatase
MTSKKSILFVCLGNICRSPLAEGVFRSLVTARGVADRYVIDSCGTGSWHVGKPPHSDSVRVAQQHGIDISSQKARQLCADDLLSFDLIVAMDRDNRRDIIDCSRKHNARIVCLREYDTRGGDLDVPDPYYGGPEGFQLVYSIVNRCCSSLLDSLETE